MHSTTRAIGKICTIGALALGGLLFAASAEASDRHRGERNHNPLNFLSIVAALHGDPILAYVLHRTGDRIDHGHARHHRHGAHHWRETHRRHHHRHFAGCGHRDLRPRVNHHNRFDLRPHHGQNHRRHERRRH